MEHERHERREDSRARRPAPEARHASPEHRPRKHKRRKGGAGFVIGTVLLIGVVTCAMFAGIFMTYVKTTLAPTLDVDIDDYNMSQSTIVYYTDKNTGEDVDYMLQVIPEVVEYLRGMSPVWKELLSGKRQFIL